jgi:hypothetical protein
MYSTADATTNNVGWRRCGENIAYYRNEDNNIYNTRNYHQVLIDDFDDEDNGNICSYTLTFNVEFQYENDTVFFAHSYPYTYSDLQDYLMNIQRHPIKSKFCKLRLLCRSLAGNNVYYLTVTAPSTPEEELQKVTTRTLSLQLGSFQLTPPLSSTEKEGDCHNGSCSPGRGAELVDDEGLHGFHHGRLVRGQEASSQVHLQARADAQS